MERDDEVQEWVQRRIMQRVRVLWAQRQREPGEQPHMIAGAKDESLTSLRGDVVQVATRHWLTICDVR